MRCSLQWSAVATLRAGQASTLNYQEAPIAVTARSTNREVFLPGDRFQRISQEKEVVLETLLPFDYLAELRFQ